MAHTMSVINTVKAYLGFGSDEDGLELLRDLLAEREAELTLEATFGEPRPNMTDEPTVVFPYTLYTGEGTEYGEGAKEFVLPDDGLQAADSPLVAFIGRRLGIGPSDVDFEALTQVQGTTATAELTEAGDVEVNV